MTRLIKETILVSSDLIPQADTLFVHFKDEMGTWQRFLCLRQDSSKHI